MTALHKARRDVYLYEVLRLVWVKALRLDLGLRLSHVVSVNKVSMVCFRMLWVRAGWQSESKSERSETETERTAFRKYRVQPAGDDPNNATEPALR